MPYPTPEDPRYCPGSDEPVPMFDPDRIWHRCAHCGRLIASRDRQGTRLFPHINGPGRRNDTVQEALDAHGMNSRRHFRDGAAELVPPAPVPAGP